MSKHRSCFSNGGGLTARGTCLVRERGVTKACENRYVSHQLALVYCYLADSGRAIASLQKALEIKEAWLNYFAIKPFFDILRGNPRFDAIGDQTGYRSFSKSFAARGPETDETIVEPDTVHNLTPLVIEDSVLTDGGQIKVSQRAKGRLWRSRWRLCY